MKAHFIARKLIFKRAAGTSRGVMRHRKTWFIVLCDQGITGIGECAPLPGLSIDSVPGFDDQLSSFCDVFSGLFKGDAGEVMRSKLEDPAYSSSDLLLESMPELSSYPSILFGFEMALLDWIQKGRRILFPSAFTKGEAFQYINGLIWMGDPAFMKTQITEKVRSGFRCLKMKIGAIDFEQEFQILSQIRQGFSASELELRVDANGAFSPAQAPALLNRLSSLRLHSIEQPIAAGQTDAMANLCGESELPIALDEELIGIITKSEKRELLQKINPAFIILKPSLLGGFRACEEWIELADHQNCGWWVTSALESNIGLNAIAQWNFTLGNDLPSGLGTGALFTNNIPCPLSLTEDRLFYDASSRWDLSSLQSNRSQEC